MVADPYNKSFVFIKVGQHAGEDFDAIIRRKKREIERTGMSFWGYGGTTCHPTRQVQPFAKRVVVENGSVYLYMEMINSRACPKIIPATMYSIDGVTYRPIPDGICVTGSRYAIVLDEIRPEQISIPLGAYEVACGRSKGRPAQGYLRGHVDKACLSVNPDLLAEAEAVGKMVTVSYVGRMKAPFAVFVR